jgi:hypothetical protein
VLAADHHAMGIRSNCRLASVLLNMMKTLMIGLGTLLVVVALTRPALAQRCLSFRAPAFFAGAVVTPGYPYPAYGYPVYPYPLPPAPSLGFGRGGIYGHVFVGRDESVTSYTLPGRDSWQ